MHQNSPRNLVSDLLRTEALITAIVVTIALLLVSVSAAVGVALGGGIGVLLTAVFALRSFALPVGATAQQMVSALYRAAALKMLIAVILFVLVARFATDLFGPVMAGYMATFVAQWIVGIRGTQTKRPSGQGPSNKGQ